MRNRFYFFMLICFYPTAIWAAKYEDPWEAFFVGGMSGLFFVVFVYFIRWIIRFLKKKTKKKVYDNSESLQERNKPSETSNTSVKGILNQNKTIDLFNAEKEEDKTIHFCKYCGNRIDSDTIFCPFCGKYLTREGELNKRPSVSEMPKMDVDIIDSQENNTTTEEPITKSNEQLGGAIIEESITAVQAYIKKNLKYPEEAKKSGTQGRVIVQFDVERDGNIVDIKIVKSVSPELDNEALRVVKSMPKWVPAEQHGEKVRVSYTLPILFKL